MDELRASQERYRALVELSPEAILVVQDERLAFANQRGLSLLGATSLDELHALAPLAFVPEPIRGIARERIRRQLAGHRLRASIEERMVALDGSVIDVETTSTPIEYEGRPALLVVARDITERRAAEEALWAAEQRFAAAFRVAPTGMLLLDSRGTVLDANSVFSALAGLPVRDLVGRSSLRLVHPDDRSTVRTWLRSLAGQEAEVVSGEQRIVQADGSWTWVHASVAPLPGDPPTFVMHLLDITERRETEARLAHQALHDSLTGLPNRTLLFDRLAQAVRAALRGGPGVTVLYLDLDSFKAINDTHGHAAGDRVLEEVSRRLVSVLRPADTVARLGGDEFAIVAEGLPIDAARELEGRVALTLNEPLGDLPLSASVGMAHSADIPLDIDALLRAADAAMYRTKQRRRGDSASGH